jgi:hypothetical protein
MKNHGTILSALVEAKNNIPIVPPNEDRSTPNGKKQGDTIRVVKSVFDKMPRGSIWRCVAEKDKLNSEGKPWSSYVYVKIDSRTGKETKSNLNRYNMSGTMFLSEDELKILFTRGEVKLLEPNKPYTEGEVTLEDVKKVLDDLGVRALIKNSYKDILMSSVSSEYISIGVVRMSTDDRTKSFIFQRLCALLDARGYTYGYSDGGFSLKRGYDESKGYPDWISIVKRG